MEPRLIHLLLVEDFPPDAQGIRRALDRVPDRVFRITHAASIAQALDRIGEGGIDVLLLDLSLPDSEGVETVASVHERAPDVPLVVLTASDDEDVALRCINAGAQDYLNKPISGWHALVRSIDYAMARKRAEAAERERSTLEQSVRSMEQVLGVIGHELRTPLAALRATTEFLLTEDARRLDEFDIFLRDIHAETIRMIETVNVLLEAARITNGAARWRWSTVRLETITADALTTVRHLVDPRGVELVHQVEPPDLEMSGDPDAVRRLVVNLLSNAARHTRAGSIAVRAAAHHDGIERWIELSVEDTGAGIPEAALEKLGQPFALNRGAIGDCRGDGAGLGLAICKTIAAVHGGFISVCSSPGRGTTFNVWLRADLTEPAPADADAVIRREVAA